MGKIISLLLCSLFLISCGEKKQENTTEQIPDTVAVDSNSVMPNQDSAYAAEIFEYRSETFSNYQLYAIYLYQDAPQFLMVRNNEARLLTLNEEKELDEGQALNDEEFTAAKFLEETETDGITTFGEIELITRADVQATFKHSFTKRALTIGSAYRYAGETGSGELKLSPSDDSYTFLVNTTSGEYKCELQGKLRVKGNIGYFQGEPYDATCKLIFLFTDDSVEIIAVSSTAVCGCGANASLNHQFTIK